MAVVDSSQHVHFQNVEVEGDFGANVGVSSGLKVENESSPTLARLVEGGEVQVDEPKDVAKQEAAK